jgi:glycerate kinase
MAHSGFSDSPVLVAPDSFKGTHSAAAVAAAIGQGLHAAGLRADLCPTADGGEGTLDALIGDGSRHRVQVSDPLGRPVVAEYGLRGSVALVETASASGLNLVSAPERDPRLASTRGTGELIAAALCAGAQSIYLGVGGSATTDGGAGAIAAISAAGGLRGSRLVVLCDVDTPFEDAARVFAPQKGADADTVRWLTERLDAQARGFKRDPRGVPMSGCAGGLSGGLWSEFDAELVPGAGFILDALDFDARSRRACAVITGEGRLDQQSWAGKVVAEVTRRAGQTGVPCHAIVGSLGVPQSRALSLGLSSVQVASTIAEIEAAAASLSSTGIFFNAGTSTSSPAAITKQHTHS